MTVDAQADEAMAFNHGIPIPDDDPGVAGNGGAAMSGWEDVGGPEGGAGSDGGSRVAVTVNGRTVRLPVRLVLDLLRQNQLQGGTDSSSSDSDEEDGDDSGSEASAEELDEGPPSNLDTAESLGPDEAENDDSGEEQEEGGGDDSGEEGQEGARDLISQIQHYLDEAIAEEEQEVADASS